MSGFTTQRITAIGNVLMLYAGKSSGVLVAFIFLPLYSRLLGAQQFGMVAVILSLQALLMVLDLGMSVLVSREVAAAETDACGLSKLIKTAELSLTGFYAALTACVVGYKFIGGIAAVGLIELVAIVGLFWMLVLQNVNYSALLALRSYGPASVIQVTGGILRAGATAYVLSSISATLAAFALTQLAFAALHLGATRAYLAHLLTSEVVKGKQSRPVSVGDCMALLGRSKAILLSSAAGAAAMQLDKPIISIFMTASEVTPYFLAMTLSAAPIGVLAAPVAQYFQPRITNDIVKKNAMSYQSNMRHFMLATIGVVLVPTILLLVFNDAVVALWLGHSSQNALVSSYSKVLLLANGLGALGYIPYVLIIAKQEFRFQAMLSLCATLFVLGAVALAAHHTSISLVCWAYVGYSAIVFLGFVTRLRLVPRGARAEPV